MEFILPSAVVLTSFRRKHHARARLWRGDRHRRRQSARGQGIPRRLLRRTDRFVPGCPPAVHNQDQDHRAGRLHAQLGGHQDRGDDRREGAAPSSGKAITRSAFSMSSRADGTSSAARARRSIITPGHRYNVDEIRECLDAARRYYSEWFFPYPWKELKLSEFPAWPRYAQGFPTNITFSEGVGFLTAE